MIPNVRWLFFDIGSTLVDESRVYEHRMRQIAAWAKVDYEYVYDTAVMFYKQNLKGDLEMIKLLRVEKPEWKSEYETLYADAEPCLKRLKAKYKIGVIANQPLGTLERLEKFGIREYFDLVVASAEEGIAKPDRKIFEIAMSRAGCRPEQAVMIGDRVDNDIVPAKKLGMNTIWIKRGFGQYWHSMDETEEADYTVEDILQICDILGV